MANDETVKGDFSGNAGIDYLGGQGTFYREDGDYRMRLVRDGLERTYAISRTIGSRFYQYFIGKLIDGPEASDSKFRRIDHVLPFGYWLDRHEWVPVVRIEEEKADGLRDDPYVTPLDYPYDPTCASCHTTMPAGDWLVRTIERVAGASPRPLDFAMSAYLAEAHPEIVDPNVPASHVPTARIRNVISEMREISAIKHAATLGISCEACHNGCKEHVENSTVSHTERPPAFFPASPHLFLRGKDGEAIWGRNAANLNWTCGRCHSGVRPGFAAGMGTWNSTEYSDALRGSCYDPGQARNENARRVRDGSLHGLLCVHCHEPHRAIGPRWTSTPEQDDNSCIKCHQHFESADERARHTHHQDGSSGSRCMNCHMPKVVEGMQDVVRTHMIYSPTEPRMLEANHPNACNLCHLEKPIDWTLKYLDQWYPDDLRRVPSQEKMAANYPQRDGPVGLGWLESPHEPTRLVAAEALTRANARWALPQLINILDDPYLLNRQFAQTGIQRMLEIRLLDFGYRYYQTPDERREPISRIRTALSGTKVSAVEPIGKTGD